jgi:hypothetical protein
VPGESDAAAGDSEHSRTQTIVDKARAGVGEALRVVKRVGKQAEQAISKMEHSIDGMGGRMSHADILAAANMKQVQPGLIALFLVWLCEIGISSCTVTTIAACGRWTNQCG